jgi:hypothetical protein
MTGPNGGTVLRTLRISRDLDNLLKKDAREKGTNLNALTSSVLSKYAAWDRLAMKFGMLSLSVEVFRGILETTDERMLVRAARRLGARTAKAGILFWFNKLDEETFLSGVSTLFKYGRTGECEIKQKDGSHVIVIRHDLGVKWSEFLVAYLDSAAKTVLNEHPQFDSTPSVISMRLPIRRRTNTIT